MRVIIRRIGRDRDRRGRQHPPASLRQARVARGQPFRARPFPPSGMHPPICRGITQRHLGAQLEARKALDQHGKLRCFHIQKQHIARGNHEEIREPLALRRQQRGPKRLIGPRLGHIIGNQPLQEGDTVLPRDLQNGTVRQQRDFHALNLCRQGRHCNLPLAHRKW